MLTNKESLDQIIVATPGLRSDPVALGKVILSFMNIFKRVLLYHANSNNLLKSTLRSAPG